MQHFWLLEGPVVPKTDQLGVPLYSEARRQELGQPHARGETLTPPSVVLPLCPPSTSSLSSTVATFQERLGMANGGWSVQGRTWNSVLPWGSVAWFRGWPVCPAPTWNHPFPAQPCLRGGMFLPNYRAADSGRPCFLVLHFWSSACQEA